MTVTADNKKRVVLPNATPGDVFDVHFSADGQVVLTKMKPMKRKVSYVKKNGLLMAVTDEPITLDETLAGIEKYVL